jgi:fatty-acid desaturase
MDWRAANGTREGIMQMAITFMAVVAGLIFSVAVALLAEELIFGQVFRLFFSQQTATLKNGQKR